MDVKKTIPATSSTHTGRMKGHAHCVFSHSKVISLSWPLPSGTTINTTNQPVKTSLGGREGGLNSRALDVGVIFRNNKAPEHTVIFTLIKVGILDNPRYSSDLAPGSFYPFSLNEGTPSEMEVFPSKRCTK